MKLDLTQRTDKFAAMVLADFSGKLFSMLEEMPLEDITVRMICDECGYPRSTFYNYFYDIYDLMDYSFYRVFQDMDMEHYIRGNEEQDTLRLFSVLYEYLEQYRDAIHRILSKNDSSGRCMSSLRSFMKQEIGKMVASCPGAGDFPLRGDVMTDFYAGVVEMLLEKCFFERNPLCKEEALASAGFLFGAVEKEAHAK